MRAQHFSFLLLGGLASACPMAGRQAPTTTVAAAPTPSATPATGSGGGGGGSSSGGAAGVDLPAAIKAIMPSSNSCSGASFPDECRTAEQAAPFISKACSDLAKAECAATIALMGLESGDMKYKHNLVHAGQGTANMMSPSVRNPPDPAPLPWRIGIPSHMLTDVPSNNSSSPSTPPSCSARTR